MAINTDRLFLAALLIITLLISGCAGRGSVPEDHFYRLPDIRPTKTYDEHVFNASFGIAPLRAQGLTGDRAILYVDASRPFEIQRYYYHHWTDSPPALIQEHLLGYLRTSGIAAEVSRYEPGMQAGAIIDGTLLHFERVIGSDGISVEVALELDFRNRDNVTSWHKEYHVTVPVKNASLHATIEGFGAALQRIFDAFTTDLVSKLG